MFFWVVMRGWVPVLIAYCAAGSPNGRWLATGSVGAELRLWNATNYRPERVIPGHGKLTTLEGLAEYRRMIVATAGHVRKGLDEGKSLDELKQAGLPKKYEPLGNCFIKTDQWIETLVASISREHDAAATHGH